MATPKKPKPRREDSTNVNTADSNGETPLMFAAEGGSRDEITLLLNAGADVNAAGKYGWTPLMTASELNPKPEVIEVLVEAGALVNAMSTDGLDAVDSGGEKQRP